MVIIPGDWPEGRRTLEQVHLGHDQFVHSCCLAQSHPLRTPLTRQIQPADFATCEYWG